ncbi:NUDIX hydrolase [Aestuariivirga sp. YIM B02566]|uniref:NUDIX hydrolase n=1 Tax=Taklimakanibacter albus TaxID=2800327 RepID=A0ACC5QWE6_9HYPH|nr:NUDIX hydrolase [Aestuariivirga sp. YIM B02566]MBK1864732.1 NUDIX hydrolase [Aestuariivirga sp. YIM B02566]
MSAPVRLQYGALPLRPSASGRSDILLITSRDTGRWIIPKGWPMRGKDGWEVAAREAFEEAGIEGEIQAQAIGAYHYTKRRPAGRSLTCRVEVFPFGVVSELKRWPERHQRRRQWFTAVEAASLVDEDELKSLILSVE